MGAVCKDEDGSVDASELRNTDVLRRELIDDG